MRAGQRPARKLKGEISMERKIVIGALIAALLAGAGAVSVVLYRNWDRPV